LGIKKAAHLGGLGVRRLTHAYRIMMIAMLVALAPKWFTAPVWRLKWRSPTRQPRSCGDACG